MSLRQAAQQALDVLEGNRDDGDRVIHDLRAALSQQPQITHADGCWAWGSQHYECALARIAKLQGVGK